MLRYFPTAVLWIWIIALFGNPVWSTIHDTQDTIVIPLTCGSVVQSYQGTSEQEVILIQDAHCEYGVQSNIAKILGILHEKHNLTFIASEGVADKADVQAYQSFPVKTVREYVSNLFMKRGLISGAEYYAIASDKPLILWGADDPALYRENLTAYTGFLSMQDQAAPLLDSLTASFAMIGGNLYTAEFNVFQAEAERYASDTSAESFHAYIELLGRYAEDLNIDISEMSNFERYLTFFQVEKTIDFTQVDAQFGKLYATLYEALNDQERDILRKKDLYVKINLIPQHEFHTYVGSLAAGRPDISLDSYPELKRYFDNLNLLASVNSAGVMRECARIETQVSNVLCITPAQKECYRFSQAVAILRRFSGLQLTRDDSVFCQSHPECFDGISLGEFVNAHSTIVKISPEEMQILAHYFDFFTAFYSSAEKRDVILVDNFLSAMRLNKVSRGVLIAGGYHAEGIAQALREREIGYTMIMPAVPEFSEESPYLGLLTGETSFQPLISQLSGNTLALASWLAETPMVNPERKQQLGRILQSYFIGNAVKELSYADAEFFKEGMEGALSKAQELIGAWGIAHAPSIAVSEIKKVGTVLFVVMTIDNVPIVFTYYNALDFNANLILPATRRPLDTTLDEEVIQEIHTYETYQTLLKNVPYISEELPENVPVLSIRLDTTGRYNVRLSYSEIGRLAGKQPVVNMVRDIVRSIPNREVKARLTQLSEEGHERKFLTEFFEYYGKTIASMAELLFSKYEGIDDRLWIQLGLNGAQLSSIDVTAHKIMLDINALRSIGMLFAQIEHGFLFNVYEPHVTRALRTLEMSDEEIERYKFAVSEFFVTLKLLERYQSYGLDRALGDQTYRTMLSLVGTPYVTYNEILLAESTDEDRFLRAIELIKERYPAHKDIIAVLESENQYLLRDIQFKLHQSLEEERGEFEFVERHLPDVLDIPRPETIDHAAELLKKHNVEFLEIKFLDPKGGIRGVLAPIGEVDDFLENGIGFDGSSIPGYGFISKSDMVARLDPTRLKIYRATPGEPIKASIWAVPMAPEENRPRKLESSVTFRKNVPTAQTKGDVLAHMKDKGITSVRIAIVDSTGYLKYVSVPLSELEKDSIWQQGIRLPHEVRESLPTMASTEDLRAVPDPSTMRILDWQDGTTPEVYMYVNLVKNDGTPFEGDFRYILKNVVNRAALQDLEPVVAPEPEFFLLDKSGNLIDEKAYYSDLEGIAPVIRNTLQDIMSGAQSIGIRVRYAHHEVAPGQYEIPMDRGNALDVADDIMLYKEIVRKAAQRNGLKSTFRAKVRPDINGSGMHVHQSLRRLSTGENVFSDQSDPMRLSETARNYSEGLMRHAREISALTNQHANSYQRLTPGFEAPIAIAWGLRNRSALVRVPGWPDESKGAARVEYRGPDPMGTTHLTFASLIAAGLDGVENKLSARQPVSDNIYKLDSVQREQKGIESLPTSMEEAVESLDSSSFVTSFLPSDVKQFLVLRGRKLKERTIDFGEARTIDDAAVKMLENTIAFIEVKFVDPLGNVHSVLAPSSFIKSLLEDGVGFDGSSISGYGGISASDMAVRIDPATLKIYEGQNGNPNHAEIWATPMNPEENIPRELQTPVQKFQKRVQPTSKEEVISLLEAKGITEVQFTIPDHTGTVQFQTITVDELKTGSLFEEGFALDEPIRRQLPTNRPTSPLRAVPDIASLRILDLHDGSPLEAFMYVDIVQPDGSPFGDFRQQLKKLEAQARETLNAQPIMAPEPEFFLLNPDGSMADKDGYYDEIGGMSENIYNALSQILLASQSIGIDTRYAHHEVAPSQFEIPVGASTALEMADNTMLFKWLVQRIAKKHGLNASFNPKVTPEENGSGMHVHQSLRDISTGQNLFSDPADPMGLSPLAKQYVGGILSTIQELTALTNQTHDSYKRLVPGFEAPIAVAWGMKNRSATIRVPGWADPRLARIEVRSPDPHGNAHQTFAALLAAGLHGIANDIQPPKPITPNDYAGGNIYRMTAEQRAELGIRSLPTSLHQAIDWLNNGTFARSIFGDELIDFFVNRSYYEFGELLDTGKIETADTALKVLHDNAVRYIEIKFPDPDGRIRGVYATVGEVEDFFENGIGFDGSSIEGFGFISHSDMVARLDPSSLRIFSPYDGEPMTATIWATPMDPAENQVRKLETKGTYVFRKDAPKPNNKIEAIRQLRDAGITEVRLSITDMSGDLQFFTVSVDELESSDPYENGIVLPESVAQQFGDVRVPKKLLAFPDPATLRILDWKDGITPKEAFMYVDVKTSQGNPYRGDPRTLLKRATSEAFQSGFIPILAPEPEFFLLNPDGSLPDENRYYDVASGLPHNIKKTLREIMSGAESIGIRIRYAHHEVAPSQYEIPMERKPALEMADDIMLYKYIVKQAAERNNLRASFNAKVLPNENGSGMHVHQSLKRVSDGTNAFAADKSTESGLSGLGESYAEGILRYAPALMALTNQHPNSYERLVPGFEAPVVPVMGVRNRSAMVRIPGWPDESKGAARIEFRMPDPMGTAHLAFAAMIHAGMIGIREGLEPRALISENVFKMDPQELIDRGIETLPANYAQAVKALGDDKVMHSFVGDSMVRFLRGRVREMQQRKALNTRMTDFSIRIDENGRVRVLSPVEQTELRERLREEGVNIAESSTTFINPDIPIGEGTIIGSNVSITGSNIHIGRNVTIEAGARIENVGSYNLIIEDGAFIGEGVVITGSPAQETVISGSVQGAQLVGFSPFNGIQPAAIGDVIQQDIDAQRVINRSL
ncbi:glutamine synthetase beta-grasp domain-containing protein [bacterium]|nr:glutamine synthetase beta-grasp domain-containing protein [bacterium]MCP5462256.1 glutamine synthetase beta-grasp domain-containing protein [bacterium]